MDSRHAAVGQFRFVQLMFGIRNQFGLQPLELESPLTHSNLQELARPTAFGRSPEKRSFSAVRRRAFLAHLPATGLIPAKGMRIRAQNRRAEIRVSCKRSAAAWFGGDGVGT